MRPPFPHRDRAGPGAARRAPFPENGGLGAEARAAEGGRRKIFLFRSRRSRRGFPRPPGRRKGPRDFFPRGGTFNAPRGGKRALPFPRLQTKKRNDSEALQSEAALCALLSGESGPWIRTEGGSLSGRTPERTADLPAGRRPRGRKKMPPGLSPEKGAAAPLSVRRSRKSSPGARGDFQGSRAGPARTGRTSRKRVHFSSGPPAEAGGDARAGGSREGQKKAPEKPCALPGRK